MSLCSYHRVAAAPGFPRVLTRPGEDDQRGVACGLYTRENTRNTPEIYVES